MSIDNTPSVFILPMTNDDNFDIYDQDGNYEYDVDVVGLYSLDEHVLNTANNTMIGTTNYINPSDPSFSATQVSTYEYLQNTDTSIDWDYVDSLDHTAVFTGSFGNFTLEFTMLSNGTKSIDISGSSMVTVSGDTISNPSGTIIEGASGLTGTINGTLNGESIALDVADLDDSTTPTAVNDNAVVDTNSTNNSIQALNNDFLAQPSVFILPMTNDDNFDIYDQDGNYEYDVDVVGLYSLDEHVLNTANNTMIGTTNYINPSDPSFSATQVSTYEYLQNTDTSIDWDYVDSLDHTAVFTGSFGNFTLEFTMLSNGTKSIDISGSSMVTVSGDTISNPSGTIIEGASGLTGTINGTLNGESIALDVASFGMPEDYSIGIDSNSISASSGTVSLNSDGTINYTPNSDFTGVDTIQYSIVDQDGNTSSATVAVTVNETRTWVDSSNITHTETQTMSADGNSVTVHQTATSGLDITVVVDLTTNNATLTGTLVCSSGHHHFTNVVGTATYDPTIDTSTGQDPIVNLNATAVNSNGDSVTIQTSADGSNIVVSQTTGNITNVVTADRDFVIISDVVNSADTFANSTVGIATDTNGDTTIIVTDTNGNTTTITDVENFNFSDQNFDTAGLHANTEVRDLFYEMQSDGNGGYDQVYVMPELFLFPGNPEMEALYDYSYVMPTDNTVGDIIVGSSGNDFINGMGGGDGIIAGDGNDVIDGGLGSNFLTGGNGDDVFYADGRGAHVAGWTREDDEVWTTVTDFNNGNSQATIWGYIDGTSTYTWEANQGAAGWEGITLRADLDGNGVVDTSFTFTGIDNQSELTLATNVVGDLGYILVS